MVRVVYLLLLSLCLSFPALAATKSVPASREEVTMSFAPVVKKTAPAVVNIYTKKIVKQRLWSPFVDDLFMQNFFGNASPYGMTRERLESSLGSGVIVRPDGTIVTNNHVIAGASQIIVVLHDRQEYEASVMTADSHSDLAVLKIDAKEKNLPYLELGDSDAAEVGDMVLAIGNPFGVGQTVTSGIISAIARTAVDINDLNYFIQTDAAINPGNSGGALVGMDGRLLGINSAIFSKSGGNMGIGFAIPSSMIKAVVQAVAMGKKTIVRPWTGINGQEVTADIAASMGLQKPVGVLVNSLHNASPARKAGLKTGDVIVGVNGKPVEDPDAFRFRIATLTVGTTASLELLRNGQQLSSMTFDLIPPPEDPPRSQTLIKGTSPLVGATIANLSPAVIEELGVRTIERGVVVVKVSGRAAEIGLAVGDIILGINGMEVLTVAEAMDRLEERMRQWRLSIKRGDNVMNVVVGG